jgi:hypothetical protein
MRLTLNSNSGLYQYINARRFLILEQSRRDRVQLGTRGKFCTRPHLRALRVENKSFQLLDLTNMNIFRLFGEDKLS